MSVTRNLGTLLCNHVVPHVIYSFSASGFKFQACTSRVMPEKPPMIGNRLGQNAQRVLCPGRGPSQSNPFQISISQFPKTSAAHEPSLYILQAAACLLRRQAAPRGSLQAFTSQDQSCMRCKNCKFSSYRSPESPRNSAIWPNHTERHIRYLRSLSGASPI